MKTLALPLLVLTLVALAVAGGHNSSHSSTNNGDPYHGTTVVDNDPRVRSNRIGFLGTLHGTMNRIADLSKLAK